MDKSMWLSFLAHPVLVSDCCSPAVFEILRSK